MSDTVENQGRRDFIVVATNTMLAVGAVALAYPFVMTCGFPKPLALWLRWVPR